MIALPYALLATRPGETMGRFPDRPRLFAFRECGRLCSPDRLREMIMNTEPIPFLNEEETKHFLKQVHEDTRKNQQKGFVTPFVPVAARSAASAETGKTGISVIHVGSV
jgi:hypothetical protein